MENIILNLTQTEFMILLSSAGIERLYGVKLENMEPATQSDVFNSINSLVQKGYLIAQDDNFMASDDIAIVLGVIKASKAVLYVYPGDESLPTKFCYSNGEKVVICEQKYVNNNEFRINCINRAEFMGFIGEEGYIPTPESDEPEFEIEEDFDGGELTKSISDFFDMYKPGIVVDYLDMNFKMVTERIAVALNGGSRVIIRAGSGKTTAVQYTEEALRKIINEYLLGGENDFS